MISQSDTSLAAYQVLKSSDAAGASAEHDRQVACVHDIRWPHLHGGAVRIKMQEAGRGHEGLCVTVSGQVWECGLLPSPILSCTLQVSLVEMVE